MDQETCCYKERYPQSVVKNEIQEKPESEEKSFTIQSGTGNQSNNNILKEPNRSINNPSNNSEVISKENRKRDLGEENDNVLDDQLSLNKSNDKDIEKSLQGKKKEKKSNSANNKQSADKILKCLETLANKAGKPTEGDSDSVTNSLTLDKSQNTVQQQQVAAAQSNAPFQLSQEQLQQIQQQYQIQSFATSGALQVKQEYNPNIEQQLTTADINKQLVDSNQQQLQSMQILTEPAPQSPHQQATNNQLSMAQQQTAATLNTMSPLQASQVSTDWSQGRIQVLPQSLPGSYLYPHVLMPGNILHSGIGQGMQVIATGKSFQSNQLTPQMLTTAQGKQVIGNATGGFTGAYATLPGIPSSQSQTLLFSPVNVNLQPQHQQQQQQQNLTLPTMAVATNQAAKQNNQIDLQKTLAGQKVLQKVSSSGTLNTNQNITTQQAGQQCAQVSQAMPTAQIISPIQATQQMQFAATPWVQQVPQFWTTSGGISQSALLAPNSIFIRGTQPDGSQGMFIQQNTQNTQQTIQAQPQQNQTVVSIANQVSAVAAKTQRPAHENLAPKPQARTASILPQTLPVFRAAAASSVSTQTAQNQTLLNSKGQKIRNKQQTVRPGVPTIKTDGLGQAKAMQVVTSGGNKMVLMSNGQPINLNGAAMVSIQAAANQNQNQQEKQQQMFQQQLKQQQQQQIMQHQLLMQQNANQQLLQQHLAQQQQIQQLQHPVQVQTQSQTTTNGQQQTNQFIQTQPTQQQTGMVQQIVVQQQGHIPHITMSNAAMNQAIQQNSIQQQTVNIQPKPSIIIAQQQPQQQIQILQNSQHSNNQVVENRVSVASSTSTPSQTIATSAGPLSSPIQLPLQPPQNPLMAMSSLSTGTFTLPVVVSSSSSESSKLTSSVTSSGLSTNVPTSTATTTVATSKDETPKKADITMNGTDFESNVKDRSTPISNGEKCESTTTDISANKENISDTKLNKNESSNKEDVKQNGVTLTNGLTNGINSDNKNDKELPKALIKPNVLTHVIEGYVIHEGTEPFPVTRQRYLEPDSDEPAQKRNCLENDISQDEIKSSDMVACVRCGKEEHKSKLKKKKYCSATCARASREELSLESNGTNDEDNHKKSMNGTAMDISENVLPNSTMDITENGVGEGQYSISYIANLPDPSAVIGKWTVNDVHDFLKAEPTLSDYAEDFVSQEIDGQALLLLNENHLVSVLGMKLGPAVKVIAKIEALKGTPATNGQEV